MPGKASPGCATWPSRCCRSRCLPSQVAYCILAGIGVFSILTFWMVQLHRSSERQRRLKLAKRQFTRRWASVSQSLGIAAAAVAAMQQREASGNGSSAGLRRRKSRQQQQEQQQQQEEHEEEVEVRLPSALRVSFAAAASAHVAATGEQPAGAAPSAIHVSPFASGQPVAVEAVGAPQLVATHSSADGARTGGALRQSHWVHALRCLQPKCPWAGAARQCRTDRLPRLPLLACRHGRVCG